VGLGSSWILTLSFADRVGIAAAVSGQLAERRIFLNGLRTIVFQ
jgi:predicted amino acid-binding ACT domain protein